MKILIGYDGSDCADGALDDLNQAGLPAEAETHILSVAEVWLPPPPPSSFEILEQARKATSQAELQRSYAKGCRAAKDALALAERAKDSHNKVSQLEGDGRFVMRLACLGVGRKGR